MSFVGITFAGQKVTPSADALLMQHILSDGILQGCELTTAGFTLSMAAGALILRGRNIQHPASESWAVNGASSGYQFQGCTKLTRYRFRSQANFNNGTIFISHSANTITLILDSESVCPCVSDIVGKLAYVYVPRSMVESYKSATNWSTIADRFRALEDFTVDGTISGDLDDSKIAAAEVS